VADRLGGPAPGDVIWVAPDPTVGREQSGRRPALVVAGDDYLTTVGTLAIVVPITTVDRGWPNHIRALGAELTEPSWAMSEQVRTISRERIVDQAGRAEASVLATVRGWIRDFLEL
jgi:mRNA interferase MazF